jgi:hypothetical protein
MTGFGPQFRDRRRDGCAGDGHLQEFAADLLVLVEGRASVP